MEKESKVGNFTQRQGGINMSQEQMRNESMYRLSVQALDSFLRQGIITVDEYHRIDKLNHEKFTPFFSTIIGWKRRCLMVDFYKKAVDVQAKTGILCLNEGRACTKEKVRIIAALAQKPEEVSIWIFAFIMAVVEPLPKSFLQAITRSLIWQFATMRNAIFICTLNFLSDDQIRERLEDPNYSRFDAVVHFADLQPETVQKLMDMEIEKQYRELDKEERDIIDSKQIISLLQKNCYQLSNAHKFGSILKFV